MFNASDGGKMAWDFIVSHWDAAQKAGGSFASAQIVQATGSFCDAQMRDQVVEFFAAHRTEAAERSYRQSIERINTCIDLKSQQAQQRRAIGRTPPFDMISGGKNASIYVLSSRFFSSAAFCSRTYTRLSRV
jgi:hypothetical protein